MISAIGPQTRSRAPEIRPRTLPPITSSRGLIPKSPFAVGKQDPKLKDRVDIGLGHRDSGVTNMDRLAGGRERVQPLAPRHLKNPHFAPWARIWDPLLRRSARWCEKSQRPSCLGPGKQKQHIRFGFPVRLTLQDLILFHAKRRSRSAGRQNRGSARAHTHTPYCHQFDYRCAASDITQES